MIKASSSFTPMLPRLKQPLLGLSLAVLMLAAHGANPKASQLYEDALSRFEKKDYKGSILQLKNATQIDSKMLPVHVLMGRALLAEGEVNAAEASFEEALRMGVSPSEVVVPLAEAVIAQGKPDLLLSQPRFAHATLPTEVKAKLLLLKAAAASDTGSAAEAVKLLGEARAVAGNTAETWLAEVPIRVRAKQLAEAKVAADKAVALDPKSAPAAYQQASVAHVMGDLKGAVALYGRTLGLKPNHVDALVARAGLYIDLKQFKEADADVQAARKADPKDPRSAYLSALLAEKNGNSDAVKAGLNEVTNLLDPIPIDFLRYRPQALMLGGLSHYGLQQFEKAKPYLEMVRRLDSSSPVSKLLAQIYLKDRRLDSAVESLEQYLRTQPNDRQAIMLLASANLALGRHGKSAQLMQEALKKADEPSMRALLGMSLVRSGKLAAGASELEATLKKDPKLVQAGVTLAGLYIGSNQGSRAVTVAEGLVKQQPKNPGLVNLLGMAHASRGDATNARKAFEQAASLDPNFLEPQINLARLDIDQHSLESGLKRLNAVLAKDEKNVDAAMEVARLYSASGQPDESLRWLQRADDNSGQSLRPALQLVEFHLARGRPDLARDAIKSLKGKAPEALLVLLAQARVHLANKEFAEARSTLTRSSTLVAFDAAALTQIAEYQVQAGNVPGAAHALDKALSAKPEHLRARVLRSNVYLMQGDPAKAEQLARSVLSSDPKLAIGHVMLGDVANYRGQAAQALESYRKAHAIEQSSRSLLGVFSALQSSKPAEAATLAEKWLKSRPDDVQVWRALAESQARSGKLAAAKQAYGQVIRLEPWDAQSLNNLAMVLVGLKDPSAMEVAERALKLQPETPNIIGTTGWAAFHANKPERALQLLRDARLRDPGNVDTRYFLGSVLAQQGRRTEAQEELTAALRAGPTLSYVKEAQELLRTLK